MILLILYLFYLRLNLLITFLKNTRSLWSIVNKSIVQNPRVNLKMYNFVFCETLYFVDSYKKYTFVLCGQ